MLTFIFYLLVVRQRESDNSIPANVPANNAGEEDEDKEDSTFVVVDKDKDEETTLETEEEDSLPAPPPAPARARNTLSRKVSFTLPL